MFTIHAAGGSKMIQAAVEGAASSQTMANADSGPGGARGSYLWAGSRTLVIAVTVLTSLADGDLAEIGFGTGSQETVIRLAKLAQQAGADGVVASPQEIGAIRKECGPDFLIVTPGIRPESGASGAAAAKDDQARTATPRAAIQAGADFLVVGRPITRASDPVAAADSIVQEMTAAAGKIEG